MALLSETQASLNAAADSTSHTRDPAARIELWYGDEHRVGGHTPQRQFNVLGRAHGWRSTDQLAWRIDSGETRPLTAGPDKFRLVGVGDFNVEVPVDELSRAWHDITILHLRDGEEIASARARLDLEPAWQRDEPIRFGFDRPLRRRDVQIVDGLWIDTPDGIRTAEPGYDRLIALGDRSWRSYDVQIDATIHRFTADDAACLRGGFGILTRWNGHVPDGHQPAREWRPNGTIGWYRAHWDDGPATHRTYNISDAVLVDRAIVQSPPAEIALGVPLRWQMVVDEHGGASRYRYRVFNTDSPAHACDLETAAREGESAFGSVLLIALHVDLTIHRIAVTPITWTSGADARRP